MTNTALYPLTHHTDDARALWKPVIDGNTEPTDMQRVLIDAVERALNAGLTYDDQVCAWVADDLKDLFTPEMLLRNNERGARIHGGIFAYETLSARSYLREKALRKRNADALARLNLSDGQNLRTLTISGKRTTSCTVTGIRDGLVTLSGKRSTLNVTCSIPAWALEERLAQTKKRTPTSAGVQGA